MPSSAKSKPPQRQRELSHHEVEDLIVMIRGHRALLDSDLALIYGVETRVLNQAVKRNFARFPDDFIFSLSLQETREIESLRSQTVTLNPGSGRHRKYASYAFTEHGAVMLATILRSQTAIEASIGVVRAFVALRSVIGQHRELSRKISDMEKNYDEKFKVVFAAIKQLMSEPAKDSKEIGFIQAKKK
jgi:hypothetical protein